MVAKIRHYLWNETVKVFLYLCTYLCIHYVCVFVFLLEEHGVYD